jgi:hypothetical protein
MTKSTDRTPVGLLLKNIAYWPFQQVGATVIILNI